MVTRNLYCPKCGFYDERTAIGMHEPNHACPTCERDMDVVPSFPAGMKLIGEGFHCNDYPKSAEQLIKDYGLEDHDSTNPDSEYNRNPNYAEEHGSG